MAKSDNRAYRSAFFFRFFSAAISVMNLRKVVVDLSVLSSIL